MCVVIFFSNLATLPLRVAGARVHPTHETRKFNTETPNLNTEIKGTLKTRNEKALNPNRKAIYSLPPTVPTAGSAAGCNEGAPRALKPKP